MEVTKKRVSDQMQNKDALCGKQGATATVQETVTPTIADTDKESVCNSEIRRRSGDTTRPPKKPAYIKTKNGKAAVGRKTENNQ
jgi:hypothetical protein